MRERYPYINVIKTDDSFITYMKTGLYDDDDAVYLMDIYLKPGARLEGNATKLADRAIQEAVERWSSINYVIGSVDPEASNSSQSVKVLEAFGMERYLSDSPGLWYFKRIDNE